MKKTILFLIWVIPATFSATAQNTPERDTALEVVPLRETVIAANRSSQSRSAVAQQVTVLRRAAIEQANTQTTADLLMNTGGIFVQKSQQGGGSPVLRGFEANRVLLVVDGVRMNNAIYRAGHLQNVITVDQASLDRAEVLFGPASTVYGSDALGGAICFFTKNPVLAAEGASEHTTGTAFVRYSSVNAEKTAHADISLGSRQLGSLTAFTFSDFGDLRMGANNGFASSFGKRYYFVERIDGRDTLVPNPNPLVQRFSGYRQYDLLQKILWRPGAHTRHSLNVQYSTSSDIPRYDRLTDPDGAGLRNAQWYYGPQKRLFAAYHVDQEHTGWFDRFGATLSWQNIAESRHQRRFGRAALQHRTENVGVYGLETELQKNWANQSLRAGIDAQFNDVQSTATQENINTGASQSLDTRYPDGGSILYNAAIFATHHWQAGANARWSFSEGIRAGWNGLRSTFRDKTFFPFPFGEVTQSTPVWSGSLSAVWRPEERWRLAVNASTGFRVPNVDDMGKVFESAPGRIIVPNPDLRPEQSYNLDLTLTRTLAGRLHWEHTVWATVLRQAIVTDRFQFEGEGVVEYDGTASQVFANQNKGRARLWGFSSTLEADLSDRVAVYGAIAYTRGRVIQPGPDLPLDHIPPVHGRAGGRYHDRRLSAEFFVLFNGKKPIEDYFPNGEDNEQYAPASGMPAWMTANLRAGYRIRPYLTLQAGVDNALDTQYRVFASGINAPGRNGWIALRLTW